MVVRVDDHAEAEVGREASADLLPVLAVVAGAVDAEVVLLVQQIRPVERAAELVDAAADLALFGRGVEIAHVLVDRLPGLPAVSGVEGAGGGGADPQAIGVGGVDDDRVEAEAAVAAAPLFAGGVVGQPLDVLPGGAAVSGLEEAGGLDAGVEPAVGGRLDVPDLHDLGAALAVGEPCAGFGPGLAEVGGAPDGGGVRGLVDAVAARAGGGGEERLGRRVDVHVHRDQVHAVRVAIERERAACHRAAHAPVLPPLVALGDERPFPCADQHHHSLTHEHHIPFRDVLDKMS